VDVHRRLALALTAPVFIPSSLFAATSPDGALVIRESSCPGGPGSFVVSALFLPDPDGFEEQLVRIFQDAKFRGKLIYHSGRDSKFPVFISIFDVFRQTQGVCFFADVLGAKANSRWPDDADTARRALKEFYVRFLRRVVQRTSPASINYLAGRSHATAVAEAIRTILPQAKDVSPTLDRTTQLTKILVGSAHRSADGKDFPSYSVKDKIVVHIATSLGAENDKLGSHTTDKWRGRSFSKLQF
jgi:hypothetical protein